MGSGKNRHGTMSKLYHNPCKRPRNVLGAPALARAGHEVDRVRRGPPRSAAVRRGYGSLSVARGGTTIRRTPPRAPHCPPRPRSTAIHPCPTPPHRARRVVRPVVGRKGYPCGRAPGANLSGRHGAEIGCQGIRLGSPSPRVPPGLSGDGSVSRSPAVTPCPRMMLASLSVARFAINRAGSRP
jgi:hypothetical protein